MSKKSAAPSRSTESRRERRIIRSWLKLATLLNANIDLSADDVASFSMAFDRADELLSTLPGYASKNDRVATKKSQLKVVGSEEEGMLLFVREAK